MKLNVATCMAPPFDINPLTKMWRLVTSFQVFVCSFLKYVKLVEMAIDALLSSLLDPLGGPGILICEKLELGSRSRLPTLKGGKRGVLEVPGLD
jgi:hypothetical protein